MLEYWRGERMNKVKFSLELETDNEQEFKEICEIIDKYRPKIMERGKWKKKNLKNI